MAKFSSKIEMIGSVSDDCPVELLIKLGEFIDYVVDIEKTIETTGYIYFSFCLYLEAAKSSKAGDLLEVVYRIRDDELLNASYPDELVELELEKMGVDVAALDKRTAEFLRRLRK